jgi:hypothetical protein
MTVVGRRGIVGRARIVYDVVFGSEDSTAESLVVTVVSLLDRSSETGSILNQMMVRCVNLKM